MEKKSRNRPILKCSPSVTVDCEFFFLGDKFVKHFSLQFQHNSTDFVRYLVQSIKFFVRFYFPSGMVHTIQCEKDFRYFLIGGAVSLGGDFRRTNGQLGEKEANCLQ
jgi:hypothetical protein